MCNMKQALPLRPCEGSARRKNEILVCKLQEMGTMLALVAPIEEDED